MGECVQSGVLPGRHAFVGSDQSLLGAAKPFNPKPARR
jgi:hypothetical protein